MVPPLRVELSRPEGKWVTATLTNRSDIVGMVGSGSRIRTSIPGVRTRTPTVRANPERVWCGAGTPASPPFRTRPVTRPPNGVPSHASTITRADLAALRVQASQIPVTRTPVTLSLEGCQSFNVLASREGIEPPCGRVRAYFRYQSRHRPAWRKGRESNPGCLSAGYGLANRHFAAQSTFRW